MAFFCQLLNWHSMAWEKMQKTILKLLYSGKENVLRGFFSRKQKIKHFYENKTTPLAYCLELLQAQP